jgi:hypothetical protein
MSPEILSCRLGAREGLVLVAHPEQVLDHLVFLQTLPPAGARAGFAGAAGGSKL